MNIVILIANFAFTFFFTRAAYPILGLVYTTVAIVTSTFFYDSAFVKFVIAQTLKSWSEELERQGAVGRRLIASIAWLTLGIGLSALIALVINFVGIGIVTIAILIALGTIMRGNFIIKIGKSILIAKAVVNVYQFLTSWIERIINFVIRQEFALLKIEINTED